MLRLRVTHKALQLPFSSLCSSLKEIWTDWQHCLSNFLHLLSWTSVDQFGLTEEMLCEKHLLQSKISCVKTWHAVYFREKSNSGSKRAYIVFHYVNSVLYMVTNIYSKAAILLKLITIFGSENLALFTVTTILSTRKSRKKRNSETR